MSSKSLTEGFNHMNQNRCFYASDEQVTTLMSRGFGLKNIRYIFDRNEALDQHTGLFQECSGILASLMKNLKIRANIKFVIAHSLNPFRVVQVNDNDFIVLMDLRACNFLLVLCNRLITLKPLSDITFCQTILEERDFHGKYLLDITKEMTFRSVDLNNPNVLEGKEVAQAALFFIVSHEVAHVARGHFEFKKSIDFLKFVSSEEEKYTTLKALEMDADKLATSNVCSFFEEYADWRLCKDVIPFKPEKLKRKIRQSYLLGIYIAHIYQDTLTTDFMPKAYPMGYARFLTSVWEMRYLYKKHYPEALSLIDDVRQSLTECFINLSGDIKYLGHPIAANFCIFSADNEEEHIYSSLGETGGFALLEPIYNKRAAMLPELVNYFRSDVLVSVYKNREVYSPKAN